MTQKELTALGLSIESYEKDLREIKEKYGEKYDTLPKEVQAKADDIAIALDSMQARYNNGFKELRGEQRESMTGKGAPLDEEAIRSNRLLQPGERDKYSSPDQYGFTDYMRNYHGRLNNLANNENGRRLAELVGCYSIMGCPTIPENHEMKLSAKKILSLNHKIDNWAAAHINRAGEIVEPQRRDLTSAVETMGGVLTPTVMEAAIYILQEEYGVMPKHAQVVPMGAGKMRWPMRFQGPVGYHTLETVANSFDKNMKFNSFELDTKDGYCLVAYPNQLSQDSIIPLGDYVAGQIAWAMDFLWDNDAINGAGTAAYGNITGLVPQFGALATDGNANPGLYTATSGSATNWSNITLLDFNKTKAKMRLYSPNQQNWKWYCTWAFYNIAMQPLQANGQYGWEATFGDGKISMSTSAARFQGHEVVIVPGPLMPTDATGAQIVAFFGDMSMAVAFGVRMGLNILTSQVAGQAFLTNETYVRGWQRGDVNSHSCGLNSLDALGNNIAGPLVAMKTAS